MIARGMKAQQGDQDPDIDQSKRFSSAGEQDSAVVDADGLTVHPALMVLVMQWSSVSRRSSAMKSISTVLNRVMLAVSFMTPVVGLSPTLVIEAPKSIFISVHAALMGSRVDFTRTFLAW
jgi:hypothetical protein